MKQASQKMGKFGSNAGMMVGVVIGSLISSTLTMYGPLRYAPYGIIGIAHFMIFLFTVSLGGAVGGLFSKG
jgi:hypothetical protein